MTEDIGQARSQNWSGCAIVEQTYNGAEKIRKFLEGLLAHLIFNGSGKMLKEPSVSFFLN